MNIENEEAETSLSEKIDCRESGSPEVCPEYDHAALDNIQISQCYSIRDRILGNEKLQCELCQQVYANKYTLLAHKQRVHLKIEKRQKNRKENRQHRCDITSCEFS